MVIFHCYVSSPEGNLVGAFNHLEKHESQWEGLSHILWNIKKSSKPPTRYNLVGGFYPIYYPIQI